MYPKYSGALPLEQAHFTAIDVSKIAGKVTDCVDPDQMPHFVASDL